MKNRTIELFGRLRGEKPGSVVERDGKTGMVDLDGGLIDMGKAPAEVKREMTAHGRSMLVKRLVCLGGLVLGALLWFDNGIELAFMIGARKAIMVMLGAALAGVSAAGFFGR